MVQRVKAVCTCGREVIKADHGGACGGALFIACQIKKTEDGPEAGYYNSHCLPFMVWPMSAG